MTGRTDAMARERSAPGDLPRGDAASDLAANGTTPGDRAGGGAAPDDLPARLAALASGLREAGSLLVALSGGIDSATLLAAAVRTLGPERVHAATATSDAVPAAELAEARALAESLGVRWHAAPTQELDRAGYRRNDGDRCFFCKSELLAVLTPLAARLGLAHVATGTNADDVLAGFRPGIRAGLEAGALTPLATAGLGKAHVRAAAREWGLPLWDKPASACLSSRIAYGIEITPAGLHRVGRAEAAVRLALATHAVPVRDVRVRDLGAGEARLELDEAALSALTEHGAAAVETAVRDAGFGRVSRRAFRSGSMNDLLSEPEKFR